MQYLYQYIFWVVVISWFIGYPLCLYVTYKYKDRVRNKWLNGEITTEEYESVLRERVLLDLVRVDEVRIVTGNGKVYLTRWMEGEYYFSVDGYLIHKDKVVMTG